MPSPGQTYMVPKSMYVEQSTMQVEDRLPMRSLKVQQAKTMSPLAYTPMVSSTLAFTPRVPSALQASPMQASLGNPTYYTSLLIDGKKVWRCSYCNRLFKRKSNLNQHTRTHTKEKPYSCKCCQRKFTHSSNRNSHQRRCVEQNRIAQEKSQQQQMALMSAAGGPVKQEIPAARVLATVSPSI
eukprot:CAMPEP_0170188556 /NCGR_PEP_ID=MMETSP0040_2-20121228/44666_1 /TAXON_ID=641309 /ORGANISM="Lotharella oceanica, Strain CCMP622" /LENGTH=182 /DNA_ID=CAMNT_0010435881 /DNA_START=302 /DNA_END=850 /DNA_ORIENTATION=+